MNDLLARLAPQAGSRPMKPEPQPLVPIVEAAIEAGNRGRDVRLRGRSASVERPPGAPRTCQGGDVSAHMRWPGSLTDSTYGGQWTRRFAEDIIIVMYFGDTYLRIHFPGAGVVGEWEFHAPDDGGARGRTVQVR
jgi:hypothetical protein